MAALDSALVQLRGTLNIYSNIDNWTAGVPLTKEEIKTLIEAGKLITGAARLSELGKMPDGSLSPAQREEASTIQAYGINWGLADAVNAYMKGKL